VSSECCRRKIHPIVDSASSLDFRHDPRAARMASLSGVFGRRYIYPGFNRMSAMRVAR
jgi:hypothetical protein